LLQRKCIELSIILQILLDFYSLLYFFITKPKIVID
jgi:hypothetical protein